MTTLAEVEDLPLAEQATGGHVPHVIAWNLTRRCNLECAHCYISAGPAETAQDELTTKECLRIAGEILDLNPTPIIILSGGEPLLRDDLPDIAQFASSRGATVVVGTNGTMLDDERIQTLKDAGVSGVAVSVDSTEPTKHDRFRHGPGSFAATTEAVARLRAHRLDFIIQTSVHKGNRHEIGGLVDWAAAQGAVAFNCYFLVPTGRGARLSDLGPSDYESVLTDLVRHHETHLGRMMVRAKCAPHFMRVLHQRSPDSPVLNYQTRCPCGTQYCRITPDGKLTPCPYLPAEAGDLRRNSFANIWRESLVFKELRRGALGGKCGRCEYREVCGGCRARAYATEGDYLASDPSCTYEPEGSPAPIRPDRQAVYGQPVSPTLRWSPEAEARIRRIPSFVRGVVVRRMEDYARTHGHSEVTTDLLKEVRTSMPVDFSKRQPFFLDDA